MAGYREFQTGEVLTAANVNDFLMDQSVMKFADAAARDTALGTAVGGANALREGMVAYLDSTDDLLKYDGTAWATVGGLVAVKTVLKTNTFTASVGAGSDVAVTDLSITHTLASASNRLILMANFGAAGGQDNEGFVGIALADNSSLIGIGDAAGTSTRVSAGGAGFATNDARVQYPHIHLVYSPGDTASHTYTVHALNATTLTRTLYVNRTPAATTTAFYVRAASSFTLMEVTV